MTQSADIKVLLADDVELFLELEKTFFRRQGVRLLIAKTGKEAYELVAQHRPDLAFIDMYMPEMNGDEVCRLIKGNPELAAVPVVMVTQSGNKEDLELCRKSGCDDIVHKPINRHLFLQTADKYLDIASRNLPRIPARLRVKHGKNKEHTLTDYTINFSAGGMFIETVRVFAQGTELDLDFELPENGSVIECKGRVAWTNYPESPSNPSLPGGMGIQFLNLTTEELTVIRDYIKREFINPSW